MSNKAGEYRVGIGSSSVLMILVVIALAALSLLSLGSARSNAALSDRTLTMTLNYYQAAAQAQKMLGALDEQAKLHATKAMDMKSWNVLLTQNGLEAITIHEDGTFTFALDAGAGRLLVVEGTFTPDSVPRYALTRHELAINGKMGAPVLNLLIP